MIGSLLLVLGTLVRPSALPAPLSVVVQSARGEARLPVRVDPSGGPVLAAPALLAAIDARLIMGSGWADVTVGTRIFRFILGAQLYAVDGKLRPLVGAASVRRDTLQLPIQFISEILPRNLSQRFRYDSRSARLLDNAPAAVAVKEAPRDPNRLPNGLKRGHLVTIDAGHGGVDPGNPGIFFPDGLKEKHVTLQLALLVRDELKDRGVRIVMTRTRDTLIDLRSRSTYCNDECDLFVSIHVNSLVRRPGYSRIRGFETYFLAEAKTEDAKRVAQMENEAVRFDSPDSGADQGTGLDFIMKDLQINEHLRESARAAELVQSYLQEAHTGPDLGVKQAGLMVLNTARRPAILVEVGFSTNPDDARLLTDRSSQKNLASSIADAVVAYLLEYERKSGQGPVAAGTGSRSGQR
ncbi:MAG TPA: N-acetylmuramoyl-L-alanine amidase [Gemmatimonadales bacterium]|nr:N-acetylmuramoyl-L-alanine amidase [Gemmatimonadales bacterium]